MIEDLLRTTTMSCRVPRFPRGIDRRPSPVTQVRVGRKPPPPFRDKSTGTGTNSRGASLYTGPGKQPASPTPPSCPTPSSRPASCFAASKNSAETVSVQPSETAYPRGGHWEPPTCPRGGRRETSAHLSHSLSSFPRGGHREGSATPPHKSIFLPCGGHRGVFAFPPCTSRKQASKEDCKPQGGQGSKK